MTQHRIARDQNSSPWNTMSVTNAVVVRLVARSGANAKSPYLEAKCTFFQPDRCRHQFLREWQHGPVRASTQHLGAVAKASGCRFSSWRTIIPLNWLTSHPLIESDGSRANDFYTTADGSKVFYEGQRKSDVCTLDGQQRRSMTFQVAREKALGSVTQTVKNGKNFF